MITQTAISDRAACLIAKKYVWQEYFASAGETVYIWEEGSDEDWGGAESCSDFAPPDDKPYKTFLMTDYRIEGAEVAARDDEQILVNVRCTTLQADGSSEDDEEEFYEEERLIHCYLEPDEEGNWAVSEAEE